MHGYNLMQAIARVNRVFGDKEGGLVVDYVGIASALKEAMNDAIAYNFYKFNLEVLGFSSDEVDLVGFAEKKASEFSKEITDKAVEKVKETTTQAAEQAKDAAVQAAEDVKDAAVNAAKETTDKAVSTVKEKVESTTQSK